MRVPVCVCVCVCVCVWHQNIVNVLECASKLVCGDLLLHAIKVASSAVKHE